MFYSLTALLDYVTKFILYFVAVLIAFALRFLISFFLSFIDFESIRLGGITTLIESRRISAGRNNRFR